ncbi:hypothetical protein ACMAZF_20275 (plasmid) [Psychrobium sp. nBUS_13]|uniref:hypothetical protein n=1 Tax=Psychrobium sp. nBUS_13 TaxID=3395319 RepID=UPI003EB8C2F9
MCTTPQDHKSLGSYLRRRESKLLKRASQLTEAVETTHLLIKAKRLSTKANEYIFSA